MTSGQDHGTSTGPRVGALLVAAVVAFAFAYRDLLSLGRRYSVEMGVETWLMAPNDRAPAIVLGLASWLAYRRWHRLRRLPRRSAPPGAVAAVLAFGIAVQAWAVHVGANDLQAVSLMAVSSGLLLWGWGWPGLRTMWVPIAFLVFCIPVPPPLLSSWLWQLRLFTAEYAGWLLYLLGLPALISGDQIVRATQTFQVIDGCSGFRSAETLTMLVILLIDLFGRRGWHAFLLLVSAPVVAIGLNGIRVLTLVLNPHSEVVAVHSLQGIAILLAGLLLVYFLDGLLARLPLQGQRRAEAGREGAGTGMDRRLAGAALGLGLAVAGVGLVTPEWSAPRPPHVLVDLVRGALPETDEAEEIKGDLYFHGAMSFRESLHRRYRKGYHSVDLFVGSADLRDRGTTIVSPLNSVPGSGWTVRDARIVEVGPDHDPVLAQWVERSPDRRLTWSWYIGTGSLLEESLRNLLGLDRSELRREGGQLAVRISTPTLSTGEPDPRAEERLEHFYLALQPALAAAVANIPAAGPEEEVPGPPGD